MSVYSSREMLPVTGVIIAQDEEKCIEKAIRNLRPNVKEVIVVDGGSKDGTVQIAKDLGCRVEHRPFDFDFASQRNYAMQMATTPWILWLDADEWFEEKCFDIIPTIILKAAEREDLKVVAAYQFHRHSIFDGKRVDDGKDFQWRLTKKDFCRWHGKVHEGLLFVEGMVGKKLAVEYVLKHEHSMKRQVWSNKLYQNINQGIAKRPEATQGCEYRDQEGRWVDVPTDRDA